MSLGFLVKTIVDGSWIVFYWSIGGPFFIFTLIQQGQSDVQASITASIIGWIGFGISLGSLSIMIALILLGAKAIAETVPPKALDGLPRP